MFIVVFNVYVLLYISIGSLCGASWHDARSRVETHTHYHIRCTRLLLWLPACLFTRFTVCLLDVSPCGYGNELARISDYDRCLIWNDDFNTDNEKKTTVVVKVHVFIDNSRFGNVLLVQPRVIVFDVGAHSSCGNTCIHLNSIFMIQDAMGSAVMLKRHIWSKMYY